MERSGGSRARRFEVGGRAAPCKEDSSGVSRVLRALTRKRAGVSYFDRHSFGDPSRKQDRKLLFWRGRSSGRALSNRNRRQQGRHRESIVASPGSRV